MFAILLQALVWSAVWYGVGSWLGHTYNILDWSGLGIVLFVIIITNIWSNAFEEIRELDSD